jgi:hypothetical protein
MGMKGFYSCVEPETGERITNYMCIPGVKVEMNGDTLKEVGYLFPSEEELNEQKFSLYQKEILIDPYPAAMAAPSITLDITFSLPDGYIAVIYDEDSFVFQRGVYEEVEETIKVWERKYKISRGYEMGDYNLNGPQEPCQPSFGFESGGIYWPKWTSTAGNVSAIDKMRSIYGKDYYNDVVSVYPGTGSTVLNKEEPLQQEVYEDAYNAEESGDIKIYKHYLPPNISSFFEDLGGVAISLDYMICEAHKFAWNNNALTLEYEKPEAWQPLGHIFEWTDYVTGTKCYERSPVVGLFLQTFGHQHSGGFAEAPGNAYTAWAGYSRFYYTASKEITQKALGISAAHEGAGDSYRVT